MKRITLTLWLLLFLTGCQRSVPVHPNSIDKLDSDTYDALVILQSLLDNTKIAIQQGKLPESAKAVCNDAGRSYNILRDAWLIYRATPNQSTAQTISNAMIAVSDFIAKLRGLEVKQ